MPDRAESSFWLRPWSSRMIRTDSPTLTSTLLSAFLNSLRAIGLVPPIVVRCDVNHVDADFLSNDLVDQPISPSQPG